MRKNTRAVRIGGVTVGGGNPVAVQSMLNVPIHDIAGNVAQAKRLEAEGCQIVRVTVPSVADVPVVEALKNAVKMPVVADIHFDYKVALACAEAGVDKIRINPGNIGDDAHVGEVASACRARGIPIRIGVNGGSLEKEILAKYGKVTPEALVESAMYHVSLLERHDFNDIVISIKSSNVPVVVEAYRQLSLRCDYPLHVGVTEAGTYRMGLIKSAMGIGTLLLEGIGDTIRVSLTDEPEKEVRAGFDILRAAGHFVPGPEVVSAAAISQSRWLSWAAWSMALARPGARISALPEVRTAPCCSSGDSRCVCCAVISWTSCVKRSNGWCWNNEAHAYAALAAVYG